MFMSSLLRALRLTISARRPMFPSCERTSICRTRCSLKPVYMSGHRVYRFACATCASRLLRMCLGYNRSIVTRGSSMKPGNGTRAERLREAIEDNIATGAFPPGMHLDETDLAQKFGVSRTPLREALIQLASIGIVAMRPRRGAVVAEVPPQRLLEMFEVMAELEGMCGRLAARRMSRDDHAAVMEAHQACEAASRA